MTVLRRSSAAGPSWLPELVWPKVRALQKDQKQVPLFANLMQAIDGAAAASSEAPFDAAASDAERGLFTPDPLRGVIIGKLPVINRLMAT